MTDDNGTAIHHASADAADPGAAEQLPELASVRTALQHLDRLPTLPVTAHVAVYDEAHQALMDALAAVDGEAPAVPTAPAVAR